METQYSEKIEKVLEQGYERLGLMTSWAYLDDPKRLAFTLSRYKFVSKMLAGFERVLEVGCGDGFATRIVAKEVYGLLAIDFDQRFIDDLSHREKNFQCRRHNILNTPIAGYFDAIYSLDVLEHIAPENEDRFMQNIIASLNPHGVVIIGMPSLQSQIYASELSKKGHVNCKDQLDLKNFMHRYFDNVFCFSMSDEVVHTGFHAMSHYNLVLCCTKRGLR